MDKHSQRAEIRKRIQNLDPRYCLEADQRIRLRLFSLPEYRQASLIFCYVSAGREVDTRQIIRQAWADQKRVAVPRCTGKGLMELFELHSFEDLRPGRYRIPEPADTCAPIHSQEIDFAVVPCLSCDRERNRLGHGGGYYDRYLARADFPAAALCREQLLMNRICTETHDRPVDLLITEAHCYR